MQLRKLDQRDFCTSKVLIPMYRIFTVGSPYQHFCQELVVPKTDPLYLGVGAPGSKRAVPNPSVRVLKFSSNDRKSAKFDSENH